MVEQLPPFVLAKPAIIQIPYPSVSNRIPQMNYGGILQQQIPQAAIRGVYGGKKMTTKKCSKKKETEKNEYEGTEEFGSPKEEYPKTGFAKVLADIKW